MRSSKARKHSVCIKRYIHIVTFLHIFCSLLQSYDLSYQYFAMICAAAFILIKVTQTRHKGSQELHKTDGTSQGRGEGALIRLEPRVSITINTAL